MLFRSVVYYLSLIGLCLFLTTQVIQKRRWTVSRRKISLSVFSVGTVAAGMAIVVGLNAGMAMLPETWTSFDVTDQKLYSITDDTREYLDSLDQDVTIYVLSAKDDADDILKKTLTNYEDVYKRQVPRLS